jgi:prepilin-type N-terminal cleavage/methylation domain-containing protein
MKKTENKKGFSLLELIVVIAIISIMTLAGLASISASRNKKNVELAARDVAAVIREGQNNAFSGKFADVCGGGWLFSYTNGTGNYSLSGQGASCSANYSYNYKLSNGVTFTSTGTINFGIPFAKITATSDKIVLQNSTDKYTICVNAIGNVEEKAGDVSCL